MNRRWQRYAFVALVGFVLLALAYKFRLRIEHFRPHVRFRTLRVITISPSELDIPNGARRRLTVVAHYRDGSIEEVPGERSLGLIELQASRRVSPEGMHHCPRHRIRDDRSKTHGRDGRSASVRRSFGSNRPGNFSGG